MASNRSSRDCLPSLLTACRQTLKPTEIILVDNGMDWRDGDQTRFEDLGITILKAESTNNLAHALNFGISYAKGSVIARLDDDDFWADNHLELCSPYLEHYDLVSSCVSVNGEPLSKSVGEHRLLELDDFLYGNPINHPTVLAKREVLLSNPYDESCKGFEDYQLWFRLLEKGYQLGLLDARTVSYTAKLKDYWDADDYYYYLLFRKEIIDTCPADYSLDEVIRKEVALNARRYNF